VPGFIDPLALHAGKYPHSVAMGDFNGDGVADVVVANTADNTVSVLLGNGDGSFEVARDFPTGVNPYSVAVGHFHDPNILDLVVANLGTAPDYHDGSVSVLLGNGDGSFQAARSFNTGTLSDSVAVGDFDGDGILDLAVANHGTFSNYTDSSVSVLLGNGDGTFRPAGNVSAGRGPFSVAVGHFHDPKSLDLAVFSNDGVSVLLGNGDGTFRAAVTYAAGADSVAVGDFTGNGILDLAVTNSFVGTVDVLLGNGDGSFQPARHFSAGFEPVFVAVGDFTGNGILDLAVATVGDRFSHADGVSVLLGDGHGSFGAAQTFNTGIHPSSVAVGDLNGDGLLDLAVANAGDNTVSVLLGNGRGSFASPETFSAGSHPDVVAVGHFHDPNILDLAVDNPASNTVTVLLGNGDGSFGQARSFTVGSRPDFVVVGDFNGDGIPDLAVANSVSNNVSVLLGNGDGTFQAARNFPAGSRPFSLAVGDFDDDGHLDLAVANIDDNTVSVLLGNGDGTFEPPRNLPVGSHPDSVAVGDFNGDGTLDLAVANNGLVADARDPGSVSLLLGNGDGTFQAARNFSAGSNPFSVAVGDFDGDGLLDLAVAGYGVRSRCDPYGCDYFRVDESVRVLLGNGDGSFGAARTINLAGLGPRSLAVGDFNRDGQPDLVVVDLGSYPYDLHSSVSVLLGNNDGSFRLDQVLPTESTALSVAVGDFNGDNWPDLVVANYYSSDVSILLNDSNWPMSPSGGHSPGTPMRPRTRLASAGLVTESLLPPDPVVAGLPLPGRTVLLVDGSRPLLRTDADQSSIRAALAESTSSQLPPAPVTARAETPPRAPLDRVFAISERGWRWDRSDDDPWLAGP
jgi:hypothetical protein